MNEELKPVTLEDLGSGAAAERFALELQRVLDNIADPNTDPLKPRSITMKVTLKPTLDRDCAKVSIETGTKLAPLMEAGTTFALARRGGKNLAVEFDPRQVQMAFDEQSKPVAINGGNDGGSLGSESD